MKEISNEEDVDSDDKGNVNDEDLGKELKEPIILKMELEKDDHKEDKKKKTKMTSQGKELKCRHEESADQKKKENSKKVYIRWVQA